MNIGERVGDYEIVAILGSGGMGQVYKVRNIISDRVEAMKVLLPNLGGDSALADRFLREIKVQATLDHPNIARLNTAQQVGNQLIMLMEYVEGSSIDTLLKSGPMELSESLRCTSQVLDALAYAHSQGVVHRDIKPANIMRTPAGVAKLMDFGIARMQADRPLTRTGTTVGSLFYMSPEQINGGQPDLRSDLYSLGVTLYEMVTGRRPFQGDSDYSIMAAHLQQKPVAPIEIIAGVPLDLNDIILMAISKEPEQRFQSADAFHAALRNFAGSMGVALSVHPGFAKTAPTPVPPPVVASPLPAAIAPPPIGPAPSQLAPTATGISVPPRQAPTVKPASAPPAPVFQVPPPPPPIVETQPPAKSGSRRGLYMALGSVATLLVLAAAIIEGPKLMRSGASSAAPRTDAPIETKPVEATPAAAAPAPVPDPPAQPATSPAPTSAPSSTAAQQPPPAPVPPQKPAPSPSRAAQRPVQQPAAQQPPAVQTISQQPAQPSSQQAKPASQPAASPAASAQLNEIRQDYNQVSIRVGAAKSGLRALQQQMQRQGVDMRGDILEAETRMEYLMQESMSSLRAGDADGARNSLRMAERSLESIEKFLGR